ncbi:MULTISPECIES: hydroxymethylglutaryl-CoA lyase [Caballeronia]|jgi:hydroxymethylglutaryl-CoA lyase|uniref:3-hydroxy-3-methylglutaryl-CoA lyase n=1 Tax=Caballeronia zhejiangensis TaxID=871203 RepID=A0A656QKR1_9BURK|nr:MULTISPECIES: hydroxymethylglutaryl-CoA lyase [Caballeronia]EKS67075.1 pyruvate carboxyltransferase [Burkholderia sp. SJ98]KDR30377.1 3-hydroxy-3-methylglutaryl-CoA lyase [Caballeronia zhejiangensis]MCG7404311.1 hydroxymethylglutaryl-CoA lyase [Caballeronia zhejiangensis]MCI1045851.1 hydroxymethylglutaryl-CoA lyase [Caballeronia zhejiangensis]MDR5789643.1 hydroxymethylglutaryl-CoA lyase [Caballeronia sp. LP003]
MSASHRRILISEVGPRDGLQSIRSVMPTSAKLEWISALAAAGLKEIEVGSFVPPKLLPQMADIREVVAHALSIPDLRVAVLAPNLRGSQSAFEAGVHKVTLPVSVTDEHALANVRKTTAQLIDEVRSIVALRDEQFPGTEIEAGVSVAFGCTIAGTVTDDQTMRMCLAMAECGVDEIGLSDTSGYANPVQVRRLFRRLQSEVGAKAGGAHFHNTRGQGLANVVAALDAGVTTIDSSQAGLGGCPYAPGATGNIVTEDLAFLLEAMGYDTGMDIDKLIAARSILAQALPGEALYGHVQDAGLPKGFSYADGRAPSAPQPEGCLLGAAQ